MKNRLKIVITTAILLAASSALAGIVFLPTSGMYADPSLAPVNIQNLGEGSVRIRTTGLNGELTINRADFPPEPIEPATGELLLRLSQQLLLTIDSETGEVTGRTRGLITSIADPEEFEFRAEVRGDATCLPYNNQPCGQIVVNLEARGGLADTVDPASIGEIRLQILGSLIRDAQNGAWSAFDANITIGANPGLINTLTSMEGAEDVGV